MDFRFWKYFQFWKRKERNIEIDREREDSEEEAAEKLKIIFKNNVQQALDELRTLFNTGKLSSKKLFSSLEVIYDLELNPNPEKYISHITKWKEGCLYLYKKHPSELGQMHDEVANKIIDGRLFDPNTASGYASVRESRGLIGEFPIYLPEFTYDAFQVIDEKGKVSYIRAKSFAEVEAELLKNGYTFVRRDEEKNLLIYFKNEN